MIENISVLFGNSKLVNSGRGKNQIETIHPSSDSIAIAKAKVAAILKEGSKKRKKKKSTDDQI